MEYKTKPKRILLVLAFNLLVIIVLLVSAEIIYRKLIFKYTKFEELPCFQYDEYLGWVPKPGYYKGVFGPITITPQKYRKTQPPGIPLTGDSILACGDSYTFCNFVGDDETWPYYLSQLVKRRVINAGVSGYGLDQVILRMQNIIADTHPTLVIISVIWDDVARCQLSKRYAYKPYFDISGDKLILRNQPVPSPIDLTESHKWYEGSLLIRDILTILRGKGYSDVITAHHKGMLTARYLLDFAKKITWENGSQLMMVIQPNRHNPYLPQSQGCVKLEKIARSLKIPVLNLYPVMEKEFRGKEAACIALWGDDTGHCSDQGNRWVAEELADFIEKRPDLKIKQ